jgi:hypothetical protein
LLQRINYVSEAERTMWESRGIRHDLGRCDRQRVFEQRSFAPFLRKYESLLERAAHSRRARCMRSRIRGKAGFLAAAGLLEYALQFLVPVILVHHLSTQEFGDYHLAWLVAQTELILFPLFLPQSLLYFLPRAAPGTRPKLVGNTLASLFAHNLDGARKLISKGYLLLAPRGGQGGASAEGRQSALHRDLARTRVRCSTGAL